MKGRERILAAIRGEATDRPPVSPFIFHNFVSEYTGKQDADPVSDAIKTYEDFGFDIMLRTCTVPGIMDETKCPGADWEVTQTRAGDSQAWCITTVIRTPEKSLRQIKKFYQVTRYEAVEAISEYFIKTPEDFRQFQKYQPPLPALDCSNITRASQMLSDKGVCGYWAQGAFNSVAFYRDINELLMDPFTEPEWYDEMIRYFSDRMLKIIRQFAAAGADIVYCGGNIGNGTLAGPVFFKNYIQPYEIEFARATKETGVYYLYHNCGNASSIMHLYPAIGMDIYESLTAYPYGDTVLENALKVLDGITVCGNLDQKDFLVRATPLEVEDEAKRLLKLASERGRFIVGTSDYLSEGTPYKNIEAFAKGCGL